MIIIKVSLLMKDVHQKGKHLLVVLNFTGNYHESYTVPVTQKGVDKEILNTDKNIYSGSNQINSRQIRAKKKELY